VNQEMMVKAGSLRDMTGGRRARGTTTSNAGRSQDFVSRSMVNSNVQQSSPSSQSQQAEENTSRPQVDFETPPFLRKKLGQ
jgi:hypothetical protein